MTEHFSFTYDLNCATNKEILLLTIKEAVDYVTRIDESTRVFEDANGYAALIYIGKFIGYYTPIVDFTMFVAKGFEVFIANLMNHFYEIRNEMNFLLDIDAYYAEKAETLDQKRTLVLTYLLYTTNQIILKSVEFCVQFVLKGGLKAYLNFLSDEKYIRTNFDALIHDIGRVSHSLFDYITLNLYTLSTKTCDDFKQTWNDLDSVNVLLKVAKLKKSTEFNAYRAISCIADDKQIESLTEVYSIIDTIVHYLIACKNDFINERFNRSEYQVNFKGSVLKCKYHAVFTDERILLGMKGFLDSLYQLSVNDTVRNDIYFKKDVKDCLKTFLSKGK